MRNLSGTRGKDIASVRLDQRYTINREFIGYAKPWWVVRFCGDRVAAAALKYNARAMAISHREKMLADMVDPIMAHPVELSVMEAYRDLADKARDLIDSFGGLAPDWLRKEAEALENATAACEQLDPRC